MYRLRQIAHRRLTQCPLHQFLRRCDVERADVHDARCAKRDERACHAAQRRLAIDRARLGIIVRAHDENPLGRDLARRKVQQLER